MNICGFFYPSMKAGTTDALEEVQSSSDEDLSYPGLKYLTSGWIYRLLNDQKMLGIYNDSAIVMYKQLIMDAPDNCYAYSSAALAYAGSET
jgi:hypothetical protein